MKQILQDLGNGTNEIVTVPAPSVSDGTVLIDTTISLISAGTERMLVDFGRSNLLSKARQQPEKVGMVLDKVKTDGLLTTVDAVRSKLAQPIPLGYCNVGQVREVGKGVDGFRPGDRVVSNGPHADVVRVPKNLVAKIPDNVTDEAAAFTVIASIGLQGIRLAQPTLGEAFVVTGAGLIGLLTVQLLRAQGCRWPKPSARKPAICPKARMLLPLAWRSAADKAWTVSLSPPRPNQAIRSVKRPTCAANAGASFWSALPV